jgi:hypothetical protein
MALTSRRGPIAMFIASMTSCATRSWPMDQPTIRRENPMNA